MSPPTRLRLWQYAALFGVGAAGVFTAGFDLAMFKIPSDPMVDVWGLAVGAASLGIIASVFVWAEMRRRE